MLNFDNKKKISKFVGCRITPQIYEYMTLYSMAKGIPKTRIIKGLLHAWMLDKLTKDSNLCLNGEIANHINSQWITSRILNPLLSFSEFKEIIRQDLIEKGVLMHDVVLILKRVKEK